jgi:hypothetical protein
VKIPGLGAVIEELDGWYRFEPVTVPALGHGAYFVLVDGYDDDPAREEFDAAIATFLSIDESVLKAATPSIFRYYRDVASEVADEALPVTISEPEQVWAHLRPIEVAVTRDSFRDRHVYVVVECECGWAPEQGLQIILRAGRTVTRIGPYDGHYTNVAAFNRDDLEGVVYHHWRWDARGRA